MMGIDLTIVPVAHPNSDWLLAYERLRYPRCYPAYDKIREMISWPLRAHQTFDWYGDSGITSESADAYGQPLRMVRAGDLARVDVSDRGGKAVMAYLAALPYDTMVFLYWH